MFSTEILNWYRTNKRDLPWRNTKNPYLIWLSEIILQQTRVEQGLKYYHAIADKYPDVKSLASAGEEEILKLWQGLGYYSRARSLHFAARQIVNEFGGKFPEDYKSIRSLKGVGDYTAAAIASFAFHLPYAVVDGNVFRLLSRYFGINSFIDTISGKKQFTGVAQSLLEGHSPGEFNQAIMEFGARQCRPGIPDCSVCPLSKTCVAFRDGTIQSLPQKKNSTKVRDRYFHYLVIRQNDSFFIRKRTEKDIWQGLHDFPVIETEKAVSEKSFSKSKNWKERFGKKKLTVTKIREYKHVLSHQLIHARFYEIEAEHNLFEEASAEWKIVNRETVRSLAVPRLIEQFLDDAV